MSQPRTCPRCGAKLPRQGALAGLCPACVLRVDGAGLPALGRTEDPHPVVEEVDLTEVQRDFPDLEILELIGRGGMGLVYRARQTRLDRIVALKVLVPGLAGDPAFAERFLREAQALARLNHPNVVTVFDFGERHGRYFLLMEFVEGASLRERIEAGSLSRDEALGFVPEVCAGLEYAHDQGIVHRDIKPGNLLIDGQGHVRIADFGLVKVLDREEGDWRLTRASQVMGTPHYMAPEQMLRPQEVDQRADLYSLGVVLYEMLTGELPSGRFDMPSSRTENDPRLDEFVLKAIEREPDQRFQSARAMGEGAEDLLLESYARPSAQAAGDGGKGWPAGRRVAFTNEDKWGGFQVAFGLVTLSKDRILFEYRMRDCFEISSSAVRTLEVPLDDLATISYESGFFGKGRIILTGRQLDFAEGITQFRPGSIRLKLDRSEGRVGRQLVTEVRKRLDRLAP